MPGQTNQQFLRQHVCQMLATSFPNVSQQQILTFVTGAFDMSKDAINFKNHVRDFLIQIKEFSAEENQDLYRAETEATLDAAAQQEEARKLAVPGIVNPHALPDDMADL